MTDWKSDLQKAAKDLALEDKTKVQATKAVSTAPVPKYIEDSLAPQRPAKPAMPGRPQGMLIGIGKGDALTKTDGTPPGGPTVSTKNGNNKKGKVKPKGALQPPPLRIPHVTFSPDPYCGTRGKVMAPSPNRQESQFRPPDMARYAICHGSSASCEDQSWQRPGLSATVRPTENRGRAQCIVGLDFGTAFTKACVQFRQSTYVVYWDRAVSNAKPFLLPGVFSVRRDHSCVLGSEPDAQVFGDLKMGLLTGGKSETKFFATAFLALATRYIRWWLFTNHGDVFRGFQIEWFVNVGLPAVPWDNLQLRNLYQEITLAGWRLGATAAAITIDSASLALARVQDDVPANSDQLLKGRICAFPEFVAQINSYRRSAQRRNDLHLLVDVGAGTVDIVTFHAWEPDDGDCYSILEATVRTMGTHILLGHRADAAALYENRFDESLSRSSVRDFEVKFGLSAGRLESAQHIFTDQIRWFVESLLRVTRSTRYATSPNWGRLPFFLAGGGREVDAYREAIRTVSKNWRLEEIVLPLPDGIVAGQIKRTEFHRVSVAYGLSDSADNIGLIERKSEVPDLYRSRAASAGYGDRYIEK